MRVPPWDLYEVDPVRYAEGMTTVNRSAYEDGYRAGRAGKRRTPGGMRRNGKGPRLPVGVPEQFAGAWLKGWDDGKAARVKEARHVAPRRRPVRGRRALPAPGRDAQGGTGRAA